MTVSLNLSTTSFSQMCSRHWKVIIVKDNYLKLGVLCSHVTRFGVFGSHVHTFCNHVDLFSFHS